MVTKTCLLGQVPQQRWIQLVLGFLNAQQRVRIRIVEQDQIRQHLDRAVGNVTGKERIFKSAVLEFEQHATFLRGLGFNLGDAGNSPLQAAENLPEHFRVVPEQILDDQRKVFALPRKMLGVARFRFRSCAADVKVGQVPVLDQVAERHHRRKPLELGKALDRQDVRALEGLLFPFEFARISSPVRELPC